jgi:Spy/CpxP family protein refolding chaperone
MKKIFFIGMILAFTAQFSMAQRGPAREKMKALQVAVFTEELDLTAKEAEKFWPLFNEYDKKMKELGKAARKKHKEGTEGKSDKEIEKMIEERFKLQENRLKLEREYYKKFKKVLPIKKVAKMPVAQRKFKLSIMK